MFYRWHKKTDQVVPEVNLILGKIEDHRVNNTDIDTKWGKAEVFTSFLAIDHNFSGEGPPILFETMMTLNDEWLDYQERYCTSREAREGHERIVALLRSGVDPRSL